MFMGMSFLCSCKERTKESTQGGRLRGALLDLLHALAGAQPHGGMRANINFYINTRKSRRSAEDFRGATGMFAPTYHVGAKRQAPAGEAANTNGVGETRGVSPGSARGC